MFWAHRGNPLRKLRVQISSRDMIEPEEIFFDGSKLKEFDEGSIEVGKLENPIAFSVFNVFEWFHIAVLVFLGAFSIFVVMAKGEFYEAQAIDNSSRAFPVFSKRGLIYSSNGEILADNKTYFDMLIRSASIDKSDVELRKLSDEIASDTGRNADSIYDKFKSAKERQFSEIQLFKALSEEEVESIKEHIENLSFIEIRQTFRRDYKDSEHFAHIIGYTGEVSPLDVSSGKYARGDRIGRVGIEAFYDDALRGNYGVTVKRINSTGEVFRQDVLSSPTDGSNLTLRINSEIQAKSFEILEAHIRELGISAGVAIVMDPNNGGVIAMVSFPSFDSNLFEEGISQSDFSNFLSDKSKPLFNRAIGGEYPSGSTIKPIIATAALEENVVTPDFLVYSGGVLEVPSVYDGSIVYKFKDWKAHGWTDVRKAVADSVNIYFYVVGGGYKDIRGLGINRMEQYLSKFGWGAALGIDLTGEARGLVPTPKWKKDVKGENWYIGDSYNTSIGQGDILATPLQIAASTMVFANGGTLFLPHIVEKVNGKSVGETVIIKDFISGKNIQVVREGMRRAVESGSSKFLAGLPVTVAGKTGTAETGKEKSHAWFTGFAPYENPQVVVTVLLEDGDSSNFAVRAAADILGAWLVLK
ncbi:MAG: penicillin-binding protein 2 [Candidatus Spechtbacteria bacterium RIFCSPHIGHO2_02_FULL_43_15b]|uniref:Penicillin-binding protein 2 n=1 Tax=Candidatus Spechtbacteria bacterium RIFCSPHIGHO2_01_FULL_43_30 TaxID=1802158 RepID=A0A1G2H705_9BACT|nr:MAG: penicillin-binding protein 2 [Candidatus Spechtbacteria bacterium RIFCSPHIGHO2_01_FULL_43_30]OGZ60330.1 MAG: penicillin-binding protein 2 [Candidatus Spechtbacteria bacterium RIFCSPHIGHO2_02_FULL_43_15b]